MHRGEDVLIHDTAIITRPELVDIGNHTAIDAYFYATTGMLLGNYVHISSHVSVIGGKAGLLIMENFSFISAGSRIVTVSDDFNGSGLVGSTIPEPYQSDHYGGNITFEEYSGLGSNVTVLPGVTIGEGSVVGANTVVTKSLEPWGVYLGNKRMSDRPKEKILRLGRQLLDSAR